MGWGCQNLLWFSKVLGCFGNTLGDDFSNTFWGDATATFMILDLGEQANVKGWGGTPGVEH